jgi:hypothetical protein
MFYPTVRDAVLREHNWNFAAKTVELTPVTNPTEPDATILGTQYSLPADCVKVIRLENSEEDYEPRGSFLYANISSGLIISYVSNATPIVNFTPDFARLLCLGLAIELSYPLVQSGNLHDRLLAEYNLIIKNVRFNNAIEKTNPTYAGDTFTNARLG